MKNKKNKLFAALALGILIISGFANVSAINDNSNLTGQSAGAFKEIRNNPFDFMKAEKIILPANFDYIEQMNNEFVAGTDANDKMIYLSGDSLNALEEKGNKEKED